MNYCRPRWLRCDDFRYVNVDVPTNVNVIELALGFVSDVWVNNVSVFNIYTYN